MVFFVAKYFLEFFLTLAFFSFHLLHLAVEICLSLGNLLTESLFFRLQLSAVFLEVFFFLLDIGQFVFVFGRNLLILSG